MANNNTSLTAKLGADTSGLEKGIDSAKKMLEQYAGVAGRAKMQVDGLTQDQIRGFTKLNNSLAMVGGSYRSLKTDLSTLRNVVFALEGEYSRLTEAQRNTDYGRMIASQVTNAKAKLAELTSEMDRQKQKAEENKRANQDNVKTHEDLANVVDKVTGKFGLDISSMTKLSAIGGVVAGAMKVLSDSFMSSGQNIDFMGRNLEAVTGLYESFVFSLNNGDLNGFFTNISSMIEAFRDLYDSIDQFQTFKNVNVGAMARLEAEQNRLEQMQKGKKFIPSYGGATKEYWRSSGRVLSEGMTLNDTEMKAVARMLEANKKQQNKLLQGEVQRAIKGQTATMKAISAKTGISTATLGNMVQNGYKFEALQARAQEALEYARGRQNGMGGNGFTRERMKEVDAYIQRNYGIASYQEARNIVKFDDDKYVTQINEVIGEGIASYNRLVQNLGAANRSINKINNRPSYAQSRGGGKSGTTKTEEILTPNSRAYMQRYIQDEDKRYNNTAITDARHTDLYNVYKEILSDNDLVKTLNAIYEYIRGGKDDVERETRLQDIKKIFDIGKLFELFRDETRIKTFNKFNEEMRGAYAGFHMLFDDKTDVGTNRDMYLVEYADNIWKGIENGYLTIEEVVARWKELAEYANSLKTVLKGVDSGDEMFDEYKDKKNVLENQLYYIDTLLQALDETIPKYLFKDTFQNSPQTTEPQMRKFGQDIYGTDKPNHPWEIVPNPIFEQNLQEMSFSELQTFKKNVESYLSSLKPSEFTEEITTNYKTLLEDIDKLLEPFEIFNDSLDEQKEKVVTWQETMITNCALVANAFSSVGNAISQTGNKSLGAWISAIASIQPLIQHMIELSQVVQAKKKGEAIASAISEGAKAPWFMQIPIIAGLVANVIASFASAGSYANGGIIQGMSNIGDRNIARVNNGEMILNGSQQRRLFDIADGNVSPNQTQGATSTTVRLRGEDIYISLKNFLKINPSKTL